MFEDNKYDFTFKFCKVSSESVITETIFVKSAFFSDRFSGGK